MNNEIITQMMKMLVEMQKEQNARIIKEESVKPMISQELGTRLKRMRTINECLNLMKIDDPGSPITYHAIKTLCLDDKVKYFKSGNKIFVNYDDLLEYLSQ